MRYNFNMRQVEVCSEKFVFSTDITFFVLNYKIIQENNKCFFKFICILSAAKNHTSSFADKFLFAHLRRSIFCVLFCNLLFFISFYLKLMAQNKCVGIDQLMIVIGFIVNYRRDQNCHKWNIINYNYLFYHTGWI